MASDILGREDSARHCLSLSMNADLRQGATKAYNDVHASLLECYRAWCFLAIVRRYTGCAEKVCKLITLVRGCQLDTRTAAAIWLQPLRYAAAGMQLLSIFKCPG